MEGFPEEVTFGLYPKGCQDTLNTKWAGEGIKPARGRKAGAPQGPEHIPRALSAHVALECTVSKERCQ